MATTKKAGSKKKVKKTVTKQSLARAIVAKGQANGLTVSALMRLSKATLVNKARAAGIRVAAGTKKKATVKKGKSTKKKSTKKKSTKKKGGPKKVGGMFSFIPAYDDGDDYDDGERYEGDDYDGWY